MPLVNNREETELYLIHYGKKGMKWGVRKKVAGSRVGKSAKNFAKVAKEQHRKDIAKAQARDERIIKSVKQKVSALSKPENRVKVEMGAAVAGALIGTLGTIALWKLSAGSAKADAQTVKTINRLFTGG